jgi:hypothetical protein
VGLHWPPRIAGPTQHAEKDFSPFPGQKINAIIVFLRSGRRFLSQGQREPHWGRTYHWSYKPFRSLTDPRDFCPSRLIYPSLCLSLEYIYGIYTRSWSGYQGWVRICHFPATRNFPIRLLDVQERFKLAIEYRPSYLARHRGVERRNNLDERNKNPRRECYKSRKERETTATKT